jgi:hypothetical protein
MPLPQLVRSSCQSGLSIGNVRFFQTIGLHAEAQPTWFDSCTWSHVDPLQTLGLMDSQPRFQYDHSS